MPRPAVEIERENARLRCALAAEDKWDAWRCGFSAALGTVLCSNAGEEVKQQIREILLAEILHHETEPENPIPPPP